MPYFHDNKNLFQCEQINKTKKKTKLKPFPLAILAQGRVGGNSTLFERAALQAAARGRVLLQSPVVFQPIAQHPFPVRLCFISAFSGFISAFVVFIAWIWSL